MKLQTPLTAVSIAFTTFIFAVSSQIHLVSSDTSAEARNAAAIGDLDVLTKILEANPDDLHITDENGWTLMHEAVRSDKKDVIILLVKVGVDLNYLNKDGKKPLDIARDYYPEDKELYEYLESYTNSAHYNAANGHLHALQSAHEHGRLHESDANGWTAVHEAARAGHIDVLDFLKNIEDLDANTENSEGQTPLQVSQNERPDDHAVHKLLQTWSNGVHKAAGMGNLDFLEEVSKDEPSKLHIEDHFGWLPIHEAARSGHVNVVELLLNAGADPTKKSVTGHTPLDLAREFHGEEHEVYTMLEEL